MKDIFELKGRTALLTGGLGRLGPFLAEGLIEAGAMVVAMDLPAAAPSEHFRDLQKRHDVSRLRLLRADITDRASLERIRDSCRSENGVASILVNNAGIDQPPHAASQTHRIEDLPLASSEEVIEVNLLGTLQTIQVFGAEMVRAGHGSIINIGSVYATVAPDHRLYDHIPVNPPFLKPPAYGASKAAVVNLTRYFATLWGPYGVRVNVLSPGGVQGGQDEEFRRKYCTKVPLGRMAFPEDLVGPLVFLASDASAYVTGIELRVDGGFTAW